VVYGEGVPTKLVKGMLAVKKAADRVREATAFLGGVKDMRGECLN